MPKMCDCLGHRCVWWFAGFYNTQYWHDTKRNDDLGAIFFPLNAWWLIFLSAANNRTAFRQSFQLQTLKTCSTSNSVRSKESSPSTTCFSSFISAKTTAISLSNEWCHFNDGFFFSRDFLLLLFRFDIFIIVVKRARGEIFYFWLPFLHPVELFIFFSCFSSWCQSLKIWVFSEMFEGKEGVPLCLKKRWCRNNVTLTFLKKVRW